MRKAKRRRSLIRQSDRLKGIRQASRALAFLKPLRSKPDTSGEWIGNQPTVLFSSSLSSSAAPCWVSQCTDLLREISRNSLPHKTHKAKCVDSISNKDTHSFISSSKLIRMSLTWLISELASKHAPLTKMSLLWNAYQLHHNQTALFRKIKDTQLKKS